MSKKKPSLLFYLRIALAGALFLPLLACFGTQGSPRASEPALLLQLIPALLALHVAVVIALLLLTLLFGRVYCSVICPLGILQDIIGLFNRKKRRFAYAPPKNWLRYSLLALFLAALAAGIMPLVGLLEPYSAFGRIAANLYAPLCDWGNNLCALIAESMGSYAYAEVEVWVRSWPTFAIAAATFLVLAVLAWRYGRAYCNTVCPVGTLLGLLSRFSLFGIRIDTGKCISCGLCAKQCKASCINAKEHCVDGSRCVACMNCLGACSKGAISYGLRWGRKGGTHADKATPAEAGTPQKPTDPSRRNFLMGTGFVLATAATGKPEKSVDGGFAELVAKQAPTRRRRILPPGAQGYQHFERHCTGCQLCVRACPNGVLRPSDDWATFMQPECSYERGYCRPECTKCADACPTGALTPLHLPAAKASIQVGHAVFVKANCIALAEGVSCGNCARHCPTGAISMVPSDPANPDSPEIPVVNEERCIGCGACEHLCPARPHSAIYVEGHEQHKTL